MVRLMVWLVVFYGLFDAFGVALWFLNGCACLVFDVFGASLCL